MNKKRNNEEHQHAKALVQWWSLFSASKKIDERLLFAIPNGGYRHIGTAKKLKLEGVRAGIPDYFLSIPTEYFHGLYIELKSENGKPSSSQKEMIQILSDQGYKAVLAYRWDQAQNFIVEYLR
jgi:hypothetical protein